jgi:ubiquinone/menaquinone biosynthesis C-methylase UbiE
MRDHSHRPSDRHGHEHDRGLVALLHYLWLLPEMWRSQVSTEVVRAIAPKAGECVVDLGAGMGSATVEAVRTGASVVAVDPAPYMRWILRLRRRWPGRATVTVLDGAAESIPVANGSIDALWSVNTIHHWTERTMASRELARAVRPGGRVLLVDEDLGDASHPWHERAQRQQARQNAFHFDEVDIEALAAALLAAGFTTAHGARTTVAGRPAKVIRAVR